MPVAHPGHHNHLFTPKPLHMLLFSCSLLCIVTVVTRLTLAELQNQECLSSVNHTTKTIHHHHHHFILVNNCFLFCFCFVFVCLFFFLICVDNYQTSKSPITFFNLCLNVATLPSHFQGLIFKLASQGRI